jgi:putative protease
VIFHFYQKFYEILLKIIKKMQNFIKITKFVSALDFNIIFGKLICYQFFKATKSIVFAKTFLCCKQCLKFCPLSDIIISLGGFFMNIELLAPAGSMEKLKTAFYYGADACYFAGTSFGLRAYANNFDEDGLKQAVDYAHSLGKKCHITVNILAHNKDFENLDNYIRYLDKIGVDAVIVADMGIISRIRAVAPNLAIHVSTQASITNKYTAKAFVDMGATRLVLARELSIEEIKEIRDYLPKNIELECFVHGAMCISYSGRCLLSNYFCGRDSNHGECVQACRWNYAISRRDNPDEKFEIMEDDRGTYILNSKDMNLIEYIDKLASVGVTSFKIEGRMKSAYYVATVVNAYRRAIDYLKECEKAQKSYKCPAELVSELEKTSHRRYTTGFYFGADDKEYLEDSKPVQTSEFIAVVKEPAKDGKVLVEMRNKFQVGDTLEVVSPNDTFNKKITISSIQNTNGEPIEVANQVQALLHINCDLPLQPMDILRR